MRIVSPYDPPIPVIDEQLQRQIMDAKLESFKVLQDRIAIADELAETDVLDEWTEAIVSLERNADSVRFAKKFKPLRERIIRMANHPAPKKADCDLFSIEFDTSARYGNSRGNTVEPEPNS